MRLRRSLRRPALSAVVIVVVVIGGESAFRRRLRQGGVEMSALGSFALGRRRRKEKQVYEEDSFEDGKKEVGRGRLE